MIIYLDYDGVLHADRVYRTKRGVEMVDGAGTLFEHAGILVDALASYPDVKIVLSTAWVRGLGFDRAKGYLPVALQARIIGATYHSSFERLTEDQLGFNWAKLTRHEQIFLHAARHDITNWFAIDDDHRDWPDIQFDQLVPTIGTRGLSDPAAQKRLNELLKLATGGDTEKAEL